MANGVTANHLWFVRHNGVVLGQFPLKEIAQSIEDGEILWSDEVSPDRVNWLLLRELPDLQPEEAPSPEALSLLPPDEEAQKWQKERADAAKRWEADPAAHLVSEYHAPNPYLKWLVGLAAVVAVAMLGGLVAWQWRTPTEKNPPQGITSPIPSCDAVAAPNVNWRGCDKSGILLGKGDLSGANLSRSKLNSTDLSGAQLASANLSQADLSYSTLNQANLSHANLAGANLNFAELRDADLSYADLREANLADAILDGAKLGQAIWTDGKVCAADSIGQCH